MTDQGRFPAGFLGNVWRGAVSPADGIKQAVAAVQEVLRLPGA